VYPALVVALKAVALWGAILVLAILNGILREKALIPAFGSVTGFIASGIALSACIFVVAVAAAPWYGSMTSRQWWLVGALWFLLTLSFEIGFGRVVQHKTWAELVEAYGFRGGNIWPVVLVATLISPWLAAKVRGIV
jgi:hypothetical protein